VGSGIPNKLTLSRVVLAPLFAIFVLRSEPLSLGMACLVVIAAFVSDILDGHLARRWKETSKFGICFDPIADKIFVLSAFAALVSSASLALSVFPLILIIIRELLILGLRVILLVAYRDLMPVERYGKIKSAIQFGAIFVMTLALWLHGLERSSPALLGDGVVNLEFCGLLFWFVGLVSFASGLPYFWKNRSALALAWSGHK